MTNKGCNNLCVGKVIRGIKISSKRRVAHWNARSVEWRKMILETRQTAIDSLCLSDFANGSRPFVLG
jgi:hypothetical protein